MKKLPLLLTALLLLNGGGCTAENAVPLTPEEVDTFADALAFMSGQGETEVTGVQIQAESTVMPTEAIPVSAEDAKRLLSLVETVPFVFEQYDPVPVYGACSYAMICTLENGGTVTLYSEEDALTFSREEFGEDGKWRYVPYRLVPGDSAVAEEFGSIVRQLWRAPYAIPDGETRTVAQILGDEVYSARQIILRVSLDGDADTEIRLYVDTAAHPELSDALTGLTLEQSDVKRGVPYITAAFHIGEEDYRYGDHILTKQFVVRGERVDIGVGTDIAYRMVPADGESGTFTDWLTDWIYAHRDDEGVKIVRWDVE